MRRLVREAERAHAGLGEASTAPPGVADGKAHAAVLQPSAVTPIVLVEAPGCVQLTHQRQPGAPASAGVLRLLEGEGPRDEGDGACGQMSEAQSAEAGRSRPLEVRVSPGVCEVKQKASKFCSSSLDP